MQDFQMFITIMIKLIIENFQFLFEIFWFLLYIYKGFSNIYNKRDKAYHGVSPFVIWNISIFTWKKGKGFKNIYNNNDK
jgi:hypothetical protein